MDKQLIAERFSRAIATYTREASVQRQIAEKMISLLQEHIPSPSSYTKMIEFGCGTGIYSRLLLNTFRPKQFLLNDLCPEMRASCADLLQSQQVSFLPGDAESIPFPTGSSLITSCSTLQWFESPEDFFQRCHALLNREGYFAFSTFGKENMKEIRDLRGYGLPYRSQEELLKALAAHFHILYSGEELIPLLFEDPMKVLYHLKQTGVNGLSAHASTTIIREMKAKPRPWTRHDLYDFCERYNQQFGKDSSVPLTYHPIYIIAKKKEV